MINKKIILSICMLSLIIVLPMTSANLVDWISGLFGDEEINQIEDSKISINNYSESWNIIKSDGNEDNFKVIFTDLKDKKTDICFVLKDNINPLDVDLTSKILYDKDNNIILDDKDKSITLKYETSKCNDNGIMKDGYHVSLTEAQAININDYIKLGENSLVMIYQENKEVLFSISEENNISSKLYWDVFGDKSDWNNSVNDLFVNFNKNKWKFGAYHNDTEWERYKYVLESNAKIEKKKNNYYFIDGFGGYKLDTNDICSGFNNQTNETANCQFKTYTTTKELYDEELGYYNQTDKYYLEIEFYSGSFIDPSWTYENLETESTLENLRFEGDNSTHLSLNDSDLIFYAPMDSNLSQTTTYDYSSNDNDGTISGAVYTDDGVYGGAFEFNTYDTYINYGASEELGLTNRSYTISTWIKANTMDNTNYIYSRSDDAYGYQLKQSTGGIGDIKFLVEGATIIDSINGGVGVVGKWYNLVVSYDSSDGNTTLYVDGSVDTSVIGVNITNAPENLYLGARQQNPGTAGFNGTIDEFMIWNKTLSASEVSDLYNNQSAKFFSSGVQEFLDQNVSLGTDNKINWTMNNFQTTLDSNFTGRIGGWQEDYGYNVSQVGLSDGLVGYWGMNNNSLFGESDSLVYDYSGSGNNGSVVNAVPSSNGKYAGAMNFDGSGDYINVNEFDEIHYSREKELFIDAWIYPREVSTDDAIIKRGSATGCTYSSINLYFGFYVGKIVFATGNSSNYNLVTSTDNIQTDVWTHVALGINSSGTASIYINGILNNNQQISLTNIYSGSNTTLIGACKTNNNFFNGLIDEVGVWNRSLSVDEIKSLYVKGLPNRSYTEPQAIESGDNIFDVNSGETNFISELTYNSASDDFYSPILEDGITLNTYSAGEADNDYPIFTDYYDNNGSLIDSGTGLFNVSVTSTNGTVWLDIDGTNYTATNLTAIIYNASASLTAGTYEYYWWAYGNGTNTNLNNSEVRSYTVNSSVADNEYPIFTNPTELPKDPVEYNPTNDYYFNITITSTNGTSGIEFDGINYSINNITDNFYKDFTKLKSDTYNYYYWSYGNGSDTLFNNSESYDYTINQNNTLELGLTATTPIDYGATTDFTGSGCPDELSCSLNISNGIFSAGSVFANYSTDGNENYTSSSVVFEVIINKITPATLMTITGTTPIEYGTTSDFSESETNTGDGGCIYSLDKPNQIYGVGTVTFNYSTSGCENYTAGSVTKDLVINKNNTLILGISGTTPIEYPQITDVVGSGCPDELSCSLDKSNQIYEAGTETFNYSTTGNENYTASSITKDITINQNNTYVLGLTATTPITYGTTSDFVGSGCPNELSCSLNISNTIYSAGTISANYSTNGNNNYSANSDVFTITINQATPTINLSLNNIQNNVSVSQGNSIDLNCSTITGDNIATLNLYNNGTLINSGTSPLGNTTLFNILGQHNITCIYENSQNYTTTSKIYYVNVTDTTAPTCVLLSTNQPNINDSSTGALSYVLNCSDTNGINITKIGNRYPFFVTTTVDANLLATGIPNYWSVRYPNNSLGVTGDLTPPYKIWRAIGRNEGDWYEDLTNLSDCTGESPCHKILNDTFSYGIEDGSYGHLSVTPENDLNTSIIINYTSHSVEASAFRQVIYSSWEDQIAESKKNITIDKNDPILIKGFDPEAYRNTQNYSANLFVNLGYTGSPGKTLRMFYCNDSYDEDGSTIPLDSTNCVLTNSLTTTEIDQKSFTYYNSTFNKGEFSITNGIFAGIKTTAEYYLVFETPQSAVSSYYQLRYMNESTETDIDFNETNVAWTSSDNGETWIQANWTPDLFTTFIREANDEFQFGYYVKDYNDNEGYNFTFVVDEITKTNHQISFPLILEYNSSLNIMDINLNGTYKNTMSILVGIAKDPDSVGNVTHNLTLRNIDGSFNYEINGSFKSPDDSDIWIDFNTSKVADGSYRINISATSGDNLADIKSRITIRNFTIDNTYPLINLVYPENTTYLTERTELNYTVSDTNLDSCWYSIDNGDTNVSITCGNNVTGLNSGIGSSTWTVWTNDSVGHINSSSVTFSIVDDIYPIFTNIDDNNGTLSDSGTVTINATITNSNGTAWVSFSGVNYSLNNLSDFYNTSFVKTAGTYTYTINSYGNGSLNNFNQSEEFSYYIASTSDKLAHYFVTNTYLSILELYTSKIARFNGLIINQNTDSPLSCSTNNTGATYFDTSEDWWCGCTTSSIPNWVRTDNGNVCT